MLKNRAQKTEKSQKLIQKWLQQIEFILGGNPIGAPFVVQTVFVMIPPALPKCAQERKMSQNDRTNNRI